MTCLSRLAAKDWAELIVHDNNVEALAKKLRKASVDPKKAKGKNQKGTEKVAKPTNKKTNKNANAEENEPAAPGE